MNPLQWFVTLAQLAGEALTVAGQPTVGRVFRKLGDLANSGADVERHMAAVKQNLDAGPLDSVDWDGVETGITSAQERIDEG